MRGIMLILCTSIVFITSLAASPRVNIEESAVIDREVIGTRDPDLWQSRQVNPLIDEIANQPSTDGRRSIDQIECYQVPIRVKRTDGSYAIARMDWCD